jgi:molybdate transport system substrate-binding protein
MHARTLITVLLMIPLSTCGAPAIRPDGTQTVRTSEPDILTIFAAASLTEAFTEIGERFEAEHSGVEVAFNFAGSQQLAQQLAQGAPVDIFASADRQQMTAAIQAGRVVEGSEQVFVQNRLVAIFSTENPTQPEALEDLAQPGLKLILAAEAVPAGKYSLEFLEKASQDPGFSPGFKEEVLKNVVSFEENVRAVLTKVILGEADAGIVYSSDISPEGAEAIRVLAIPDHLNIIANYYIAPVSDSRRGPLASVFVDFARSSTSQEILGQHGFIPVR